MCVSVYCTSFLDPMPDILSENERIILRPIVGESVARFRILEPSPRSVPPVGVLESKSWIFPALDTTGSGEREWDREESSLTTKIILTLRKS